MTSVLVTGGAGLLGAWLLRTAPPGVEVHATRHRAPVPGVPSSPVDLSDGAATTAAVDALRPDVVLHTAYAKRAGERHIVAASRNVAAAASAVGAGLVHISSDVVFDGEHAPYAENAALAPVEEYGRHKAAAEREVAAAHAQAAVVRTSLICSTDPPDHAVRELAAAWRAGRATTLYDDELRCPIAAADLAATVWELVRLGGAERAGPWHIVGPEAVSRWTLGCLVAAHLGVRPDLRAAANATHPTPRPRDLRLTTARADAALQTRPRPVGALFARGSG